MEIDSEVNENRKPEANVDALFINRWSPRAFDANKDVSDEDLKAILEAAKWSPSSFNEQPWRFVVARSEEDKKKFLGLMVEFNQSWSKNAGVLICSCAMMHFKKNDKPNRHAYHDAGAAWMSLALAATKRGLITHGMAGFDHERAKEVLGLPDGAEAVAMFALGHRASKEDTPEDFKDEAPNQRRALGESCFEGEWGKSLYG